jgi:hypothetical protein
VEVDDWRSLVTASTPDPKLILLCLGYGSWNIISTNQILLTSNTANAIAMRCCPQRFFLQPTMANVTVHIHILWGHNLAIKDLQSSDPFVRVYASKKDKLEDYLFQSKCKSKTSDPSFNDRFKYSLNAIDEEKLVNGDDGMNAVLCIFDDDGMHGEDPMGMVIIPLTLKMVEAAVWYPVGKGEGEFACDNASGELNVTTSTKFLISTGFTYFYDIYCTVYIHCRLRMKPAIQYTVCTVRTVYSIQHLLYIYTV